MAANKFLRRLISFCAVSLVAIGTVCADDVDCSIKLWTLHYTSNVHYHSVLDYPCTPQLFGASMFSVLSYRWNKCTFSDTYPANACGRVGHAPFDGRSHIAVVPTCMNGPRSDCSLEEKARNLGQANYVAFITWYDYNCSNSIDLQPVTSARMLSVPVVVTEENGRELLLSANNPDFVVDIYIEYSDTFALAGFVVALCVLFCLCFCFIYCTIRLCCRSSCQRSAHRRQSYRLSRRALNRIAVKCTYKMGHGMNETCSICLEEFTEGEEVRQLPCLHVYHGGCVETWLNKYRHTCPLCKTPITARKKKGVAASNSDVAPLMAAADEEADISDGSLEEDEEEESVGTSMT